MLQVSLSTRCTNLGWDSTDSATRHAGGMKDVATSTEIQRRDLFQFLNIRQLEKTQSFLYKYILQKTSSSSISWVNFIATRISWQIFCGDLCLQGGFNISRTFLAHGSISLIFGFFCVSPCERLTIQKEGQRKSDFEVGFLFRFCYKRMGPWQSPRVQLDCRWSWLMDIFNWPITKKKSSFG